MFRGLCVYLSVFLAFPPQVWIPSAQAQPPVAPAPAVPVAAPAAAPANDRLPLVKIYHQASWKMAALIKERIPGIVKIRQAEYRGAIEPYADCPSPFAAAPTSLADFDREILVPVQAALAAFLTAHAAELGTVAFFQDPALVFAEAPIEVLTSSLNNGRCVPVMSRGEATTLAQDEDSIQAWIAAAQRENREYLPPYFVALAKSRGGILTNVEFRRWAGWLAALRNFRNLLARHLYIREGRRGAVPPAPELRVGSHIGRKFQQNIRSERADLARAQATQILAGNSVGLGLARLPRFSPCLVDGKPDAAVWCFAEGERTDGMDAIDEDIVLTLQNDAPAAPGIELNALRKLGIKGLMMELATVNSLLQTDAVGLEPA